MLIWWYYGMAMLGSIIGFVQGWRGLKRSRQGTVYENALAHWKINPARLWEQGAAGAFVVINTGSISVLGILLILSIQRIAATTTTPIDVVSFSFNCLLVTYNCGVLLALPIGNSLIRPMSIFVLPNGVGVGAVLIPWARFDHFSIDDQHRLIRLYSREIPSMVEVSIRLPNSVALDQAAGLLGQYLLSDWSGTSPRWYGNKAVFVGITLLYTLPLVGIGVLLYLFGPPSVWLYYLGSILAIRALSVSQLRIFQMR